MVHFGRLLLGSLLVVALVACAAPTAGSKPAAGAAAPAPVAPTASTAAASAGSGQAPASAASAPAPLNPPVTVQVASVGSIADAGLYVAMDRGYFAAEGLQIEISATNGISRIISALSPNQVDVAGGTGGAALFNAYSRDIPVKLVADKGRLSPGRGYFALMVRQDLLDSGQFKTLADLRGKTIAADAINTGWSFVLYRVLRQHRLERSDYTVREVGAPFRRFEAMRGEAHMAAAILNPPFAIHAQRAGLKDMGAVVDTIGPYLGTVPYVLRTWAEANADTLARYLASCIEGLRWSLDPANKSAAEALYTERLNVPPDIAAQMYATATDPKQGFARDAVFDADGFKNVLALRAEFEGGPPPSPQRYLDLSYYRRALMIL